MVDVSTQVSDSTKQSLIREIGIGLFAVAVAVAGLVGCSGGGADPTGNYQDLGVGKPHGVTPRDQLFLDRSFLLTADEVTFVEGTKGSFNVTARFFQKVDSYGIKIATDTDGADVKIDRVMAPTGAPTDTWTVTWTPPQGFVGSKEVDRKVGFKLELIDVKSSDPSVEATFRMIEKVQDGSFRVRRSGKPPEIVKVSGLGEEVAQGSMAPFSVEVFDPASFDGNPPRLDVFFQGTNKSTNSYQANGATYIRTETVPKFLGQGRWKFDFIFDARNNDVGAQLGPDGKRVPEATHLETAYWFKVYGAGGIMSPQQQKTTRIKYLKPQTAEVRTEDCSVVVPAPKAAAKKKK